METTTDRTKKMRLACMESNMRKLPHHAYAVNRLKDK
jgi:hypothetical protein